MLISAERGIYEQLQDLSVWLVSLIDSFISQITQFRRMRKITVSFKMEILCLFQSSNISWTKTDPRINKRMHLVIPSKIISSQQWRPLSLRLYWLCERNLTPIRGNSASNCLATTSCLTVIWMCGSSKSTRILALRTAQLTSLLYCGECSTMRLRSQ